MDARCVLDPRLLEWVSEEDLAHEPGVGPIPYERECKLALGQDEIIADDSGHGFLVDSGVVTQLEAIEALTDVGEGQLPSYLRGTG